MDVVVLIENLPKQRIHQVLDVEADREKIDVGDYQSDKQGHQRVKCKSPVFVKRLLEWISFAEDQHSD